MTQHPLFTLKHCPRCGSMSFQVSSPRSKQCAECSFEFFVNVASCVGTILVDKHQRVLLIKRKMDPQKGYWDFPGGFLEINESIEEAGSRELQEECGITISSQAFSTLCSLPDSYRFSSVNIPVMTTFLFCQMDSINQLKAGDDADTCMFFPLKAVPIEKIAFLSSQKALTQLLNMLG